MSEMNAIKDALTRAEKTVTLRPERGQRTYCSVATVGEGTRCDVAEAGRTLTLDVGKALGGQDAGPNPSMVYRSAMSGCIAIGVKQWAARRDVPVEHVEVSLETDVDARGQLGVRDDIVPGFEAIRLSIVVTSTASQEEIEQLVTASLKYSPLMDALLRPQSVERHISVVRSHGSTQPSGGS
ncbi:MAG: OsmC family protein [Pseudomonadota bacterium]